MIRYLSVEQVVSLHQSLVGPLSGDPGVRDLRALEAAVLRPALSFDGEDLHPSLEGKAAALLHALIVEAPFSTANHAAAVLAAEVFLLANGRTLQATDADIERLLALVASRQASPESVAIWIGQRTGAR